jgi:cell division protein FtsW
MVWFTLAVGFYSLFKNKPGLTQSMEVLLAAYLISLIFMLFQVNYRNYALFPLITLLNGTGLLLLYRLEYFSALNRASEFNKQAIFSASGLIFMILTTWVLKVTLQVDVHRDSFALLKPPKLNLFLGWIINRIVFNDFISYHVWLIISLILLALPIAIGGGMRINLGTIQIQPSEFVKITFIFYLTYHLVRYREKIGGWETPIRQRLGFLVFPLITLSLPFFGYILQKDFGPLMLYSVVLMAMFFVGTSRVFEVAFTLGFLSSIIFLYNTFYPIINAMVPKYASIIVDRINIWQNPWLHTKGEQIVRSLWAIQAGGLWGTGLGVGHPEFFSSEVQTDFIYTLQVHESGLLGGFFVILAYLCFTLMGIRIAFANRDDYNWNAKWAELRLLLALGCTLIIFVQAMINIGGVSNYSLMTGITLPFISYGGTSIVVSYILAGILLFCSLSRKELRFV